MFKCTECGYIHKIKPEYCDCGNNVFDEIVVKTDEPASKTGLTFEEQYPFIKKIKSSFDPLSVIIFGVCIILSVIPWVIVLKNPPKKENHKPVQTEKIQKFEIPDINKIWNDAPPAVLTAEPLTPAAVTKPIINDQVNQIVKPKIETVRQSVPKSHRKPQNVQKAKPIQPVKPVQQAKLVQKPKNDVVSRIEQNLNKPVHEKPSVNQSKPKTVEKPVYKPTSAELAELNYYKNTLRMVLLSKLNVQSINGEGSCDIEFSIDKNSGKLLNRKFSKQSANKSLNDAIYVMLMSVPVYKIPPKAYSSETIKLHFYINNGYYEISFK